jgi:hypothetical protein
MGVESWSSTAADNDSSPPNGFPEGQAPSTLNDSMRQCMASIRTWYEDAQWTDLGHTPTRVDDDTFTVATDLTAVYHAGRRLKLTGSATGYCSIASSSYSAPNTTVNVTMDSGNVPATLSAVYVALLSASNLSIPLLSATWIGSGTLSDSRLSSNVPLKDAANTFTAQQNIEGASQGALTIRKTGEQGWSWYSTGDSLFALYDNSVGLDRLTITGAGNWTINAPGSGNTLALTQGASDRALTFTDGTVQGIAQTVAGTHVGYGAISNHDVNFYAQSGNLRMTLGGGLQIGSPTGGDKGAGTLNAAGTIYQNNVAVVTAPLVAVGATLDISTIVPGQSAFIYKDSTTSRTSDDTLTLDPHLQFTSAPAGRYHTEGALLIEQVDNLANFQIDWPRGVYGSGVMTIPGTDATSAATFSALKFMDAAQEVDDQSSGVSEQVIGISGLEVATVGQTLGPRWAQATSNVNATRVRAGSWLKVTRLT